MMLETTITTPMFLNNTAAAMLHAAAMSLSRHAIPGEAIEVSFVGMTKDSDGWPMKRWQLKLIQQP